jgi:fructose-specific phosphotransferase system IIC component
MPVIGVAVGVYVSSVAFGREAEVTRAAGEEVCGLGGVPPLFAGFLGGVLGGILAGAVVAELVSWAVRRGRCFPRTDD